MTRWPIGALVAEETQTSPGHAGPCGVCGTPMVRADRIARLADGTGRWAHTSCLRYLEPPPRERARTWR